MKKTIIIIFVTLLTLTACSSFSSSRSMTSTSTKEFAEVIETPTPTEKVEVTETSAVVEKEEEETLNNTEETDLAFLKKIDNYFSSVEVTGKGIFAIHRDGNMVRFVKGKQTFKKKIKNLREGETNFSLYYDSKDDKMFLMTAVEGKTSDFLYVFSDYDTSSEVEYLGEFGCVTTDLIEYSDDEGKYHTIEFGKYK